MTSGRSSFLLFVTSLAFVAACGGCGPKAGLNVPTGTVAGKVTLAGQPLTNASITFFGEGLGDTGSGILQSDGTYTLKYGNGFSVPAGDYRVAITSARPQQAPPDPNDLMANPDKYAQNESIPVKYRDPQTSGMIAVVKAGSNTDVNFDLK